MPGAGAGAHQALKGYGGHFGRISAETQRRFEQGRIISIGAHNGDKLGRYRSRASSAGRAISGRITHHAEAIAAFGPRNDAGKVSPG